MVVLCVDPAGACLEAHVDVFGNEDDSVLGMAVLKLAELVDDLVVVEVVGEAVGGNWGLVHEDLAFAQQHLRMLSGLYGVLRPLDLMQPYRLEMGTKLSNPRGKDLYSFWGDRISESLNQDLQAQGDEILLNLASQEYFGAIRPAALKARVIEAVFKDRKNGEYKIISFHAKKARGMMARYVIKERLTDSEGLKDFDLGGYRFDAPSSDPNRLVFLRDQA